MDALRWEKIGKALDELLDLAPKERKARLDEITRGDPHLRADLERVLTADSEERSGVLDRGIGPLAGSVLDETDEASTPAGKRIGPYRVLGVLGRGGMGEVLRAERADGEFEHLVALKVVPGDRRRPEFAARLRQERQILARLRHPNVAALYDGGVSEAGAPYFAMELVEGEPITDYCDRKGLSIDARLRLFDSVCLAVQFAHRNLVIHRDIKPSNVFVTGEGTVKLLDFGIAKLVEDGDSTQTEQRFLTPAFAAPEQLRGEPTSTAADVYAMGVLLYELLTGGRPYGKKTDSAAMLRAVLEEEPIRASELTTSTAPGESLERIARRRSATPDELRRILRGDLETILDKAMRKDPEDRYASAEQLRLDLRRFLDSQPVSARPATTGYKLRKFVRRNRLAVAVGTTAVCAGLGFSIWVGVLYARAEANMKRALGAEASTAREAETLRQVSDFLTELFEVASPEVSHGRDVTARELLDAGAERIEGDLDTEPRVRASLLLTMAASYQWLGRYEEALRLAVSAAAIRRELFGEESAELAEAEAEIGWLQLRLGDYEEAERTTRDVSRILEGARGPHHPDVAEAYSALGAILYQQGRFAEAESAMVRALAIHEGAPEPDPELVALASNDLAAVLLSAGRTDEAGDLLARAVEAHVAAGDTTHPAFATYLSNLGDLRMRQDRFEEAEGLIDRALGIATATLGADNVELAERHNAMGMLMHRLARYDEAERHFLRAVEIWRANLPEGHPKIVWTLDNLAAAYIDAGRLDEADGICEDVVRMSEISVGLESVYHGVVLLTMADLREAQGRWAEAGELRERAIPLYEAEFGTEHRHVAQRVLELGRNRLRLGRRAEAEAHFRRALAIYEKTDGPDGDGAKAARAELASLRRPLDGEGEGDPPRE